MKLQKSTPIEFPLLSVSNLTSGRKTTSKGRTRKASASRKSVCKANRSKKPRDLKLWCRAKLIVEDPRFSAILAGFHQNSCSLLACLPSDIRELIFKTGSSDQTLYSRNGSYSPRRWDSVVVSLQRQRALDQIEQASLATRFAVLPRMEGVVDVDGAVKQRLLSYGAITLATGVVDFNLCIVTTTKDKFKYC